MRISSVLFCFSGKNIPSTMTTHWSRAVVRRMLFSEDNFKASFLRLELCCALGHMDKWHSFQSHCAQTETSGKFSNSLCGPSALTAFVAAAAWLKGEAAEAFSPHFYRISGLTWTDHRQDKRFMSCLCSGFTRCCPGCCHVWQKWQFGFWAHLCAGNWAMAPCRTQGKYLAAMCCCQWENWHKLFVRSINYASHCRAPGHLEIWKGSFYYCLSMKGSSSNKSQFFFPVTEWWN